ncbi:MAG: WYL domain-containing protein [Luteolibacter sp.]
MNRLQNDIAELMQDADHRVGVTRRPLYRIYEIHSAILSGSYPNCTKLAEQFCVKRKTVQRDITFMRDELKLPVKYADSLHGYYYDEDVSAFPVFQTTSEELAGLFLARTALESVRGTPMADVMDKVFANLTRGMAGKIEFAWADLDAAFSRKTVKQVPSDVKRFGDLAQSILNKRVISFFYRKLGADSSEPRMVQPLHLSEVDGGWYLIAMDMERGALRTFALPRMTRLKMTNKSFNRPLDFNGGDHMKQSFGIWSVSGDYSRQLVRVELKNYAARLAQERRWHPTQEIFPLNGKSSRIEIRFEVGRLEEVLRWILSFGSQAKVIGPPELVKMVRDEVDAMQGS